MFRLLIAVAFCVALTKAASVNAAVYTGDRSPTTRAANPALPAGPLFPGISFGSPADYDDSPENHAALAAAVNELFNKPSSSQRPHTVASLYGDSGTTEKAAVAEETEATIPVFIAGVGNQPPIRIFTGADTSRILSQLFAGILDVDERTFARDQFGQTAPATVRTSGGGGGIAGRRGSLSGDFLATQVFGTESRWIDSNPIRSDFGHALPPFEEEKTAKTSDLLRFVLLLLNPYFYGALLLLLLFSIAWSVRSRFSGHSEPDL